MKTEPGRVHSAALHLDFPAAKMTIFLKAYGDPEHVRRAIRAACSHRRTIVTTRPNTFVGNVYMHLAKQAQDIAEYYDGREAYDYARNLYEWTYLIQYEGLRDHCVVHLAGRGQQRPLVQGLFQFLGTEYKREYKAKTKSKGRPKDIYMRPGMIDKIEGLTPKERERYRRLANARAAKAHIAAAKHQATTAATTAVARNGDALGLKDKRTLKVDFTGVPSIERDRGETIAMFEAPEDVPISKRELNEEIRDLKGKLEMSDEEAHELDDLYGEEIKG